MGFSPSSDLLRCGFSLSVGLVRNKENEVLDLEFFLLFGNYGKCMLLREFKHKYGTLNSEFWTLDFFAPLALLFFFPLFSFCLVAEKFE